MMTYGRCIADRCAWSAIDAIDRVPRSCNLDVACKDLTMTAAVSPMPRLGAPPKACRVSVPLKRWLPSCPPSLPVRQQARLCFPDHRHGMWRHKAGWQSSPPAFGHTALGRAAPHSGTHDRGFMSKAFILFAKGFDSHLTACVGGTCIRLRCAR